MAKALYITKTILINLDITEKPAGENCASFQSATLLTILVDFTSGVTVFPLHQRQNGTDLSNKLKKNSESLATTVQFELNSFPFLKPSRSKRLKDFEF